MMPSGLETQELFDSRLGMRLYNDLVTNMFVLRYCSSVFHGELGISAGVC